MMDYKNKYLLGTVRILLALLLISAAVGGYISSKKMLSGEPVEGVPPEMVEVTKVYWETGIMQLIKVMEIVIGVMLIINFLPALAITFLAPLSVGFGVFNLMNFNMPGVVISLIIGIANLYLAYVHWEKFEGLFKR